VALLASKDCSETEWWDARVLSEAYFRGGSWRIYTEKDQTEAGM